MKVQVPIYVIYNFYYTTSNAEYRTCHITYYRLCNSESKSCDITGTKLFMLYNI